MTTAIEERPIGTRRSADSGAALDRVLDELESLILTVPPMISEAPPRSGGATIGQHVSRCLDLIDAFVSVGPMRTIVYERPEPTAARDMSPAATLRRIRTLRNALSRCRGRSLDAVIRVERSMSPSGDLEPAWSTLGNELAFIVSHVVDTQRVITRLMHAFGQRPPDGFGSAEPPSLRARSSVPPSWALWRLLDELGSLLIEVTPEVYCARLAPAVSGTIGEHVRHCLDHVSALLTADSSTTLSYDHRRRGTAVETDPGEAVREVLRLKDMLGAWTTRALDEPIRVTSMLSPSGESATGWSTLARELAFVVSHTIHHQATIAVLLAIHGQRVPERFGHSPSTPHKH